jgi:putative ABC transport system permease protein
MSVVVRGAKNAFRNWLRTGAVVLILAIGIGLALSMLVAKQAVEGRISDLKAQVGTTLTVNPAGGRGMEGGGEPLTAANADTIKKLANVSAVDTSVNFMLRNQDDTNSNFMMKTPSGSTNASGKTSLQSSIDAGTLGKRFNAGSSDGADIKLPIRGLGISGNLNDQGKAYNITSGRALTSSDTTQAIIGKELAAKNNLQVGSTFTAYDKTFTVVGIYDQGTKFENDSVVISLAEAQQLTGQTSEVGSIIVTVNNIENLDSVTAAIKSAIGSDKVDVTSSQQNIKTAIESLQSVQKVSVIGFIAALVAAAVITFLIMLVIVRERRREIGVLKAIGGSNRTIVSQFIVEALVLVVMASVVGLGVALVSSNGIANALVTNTANNSSQNDSGPSVSGSGSRAFHVDSNSNGLERASSLVGQVTASVGPMTILWGAIAALAIAIVGSAVPAWLIAKVRPAEVMRGE